MTTPQKVPDKPQTSLAPHQTLTWWLVGMALLAWNIVALWPTQRPETVTIPYSTFFELVTADRVQSVTLRGQDVSGELKSQQQLNGQTVTHFRSMLPEQPDRELLPLLRKKGVKTSVESRSVPPLSTTVC